MPIYADLPVRRVQQVLADVLGLAWCLLTLVVADAVHDSIASLAAPGERLEESGQGLADGLSRTADRLGGIPFVGDDAAAQAQRAADAAAGVAEVGRTTQDYATQAAVVAGVSLALGAIALAVAVWVLPRARWIHRAGQARAAMRDEDGADLLALRALATAPVGEVAGLGEGLMEAWRRGDPDAVRRLASYELSRLGLAPDAPGR
ncbi:MAG TPA: hypothetical protein VK894_06765 [Jiangellales bacterium]|nr:hypothetical protein [Jiangellales bacterium]